MKTETPRTWTLSGAKWDDPIVIDGPRLDKENVKAYEAGPVDAEREQWERARAALDGFVVKTMRLEKALREISEWYEVDVNGEYTKRVPRDGHECSRIARTALAAEPEGVIERGTAERERMLDVIERLLSDNASIAYSAGGEAEALLREHGRLPKEERIEATKDEDEYDEQARVEAEAQAREP